MRYIYYVQKVYSEYIILKIQFVGMMTQGRDWCQPDCIPNVHLMQAPTKVATIAFSIFSIFILQNI